METGQPQFLYEHRDGCSNVALLQILIYLISFAFTYTVWWAPTFGLIIALVGYYGTSVPVVASKVSFVQFYYFGNCFILILQVLSAILLVVFVSAWQSFDEWAWVVVILGSLCFMVELYITWTAISRSNSYRAELLRNPPPETLVVYQQPLMSQAGNYQAPPPADTKAM